MSRLIFAGVIIIVVAVSAGVLLINSPEAPQPISFEEQIADIEIKEPEAVPQEKRTTIRIPTSEPKPEISSPYLSTYTILDETFGTEMLVVAEGETRIIKSNALPNHETGEFPNDDNPNTIEAQNLTFNFPLTPTRTTSAKDVMAPGVAVNGVPFEPETAEEVVCESGETYRIEAFQNLADLGFDESNAHVQPTGKYHYHGVPTELIELLDTGNDLIHIGFARDGHYMYYSKSGAYTSSYQVASSTRTGENCSYTVGDEEYDIDIASTSADGTFVSDWEFVKDLGDLDQCNGIRLGDEYAYIVTDTYPFVSRCLYGVFTESRPMTPPPPREQPPEDGPPPSEDALDGPPPENGPPPDGPPPPPEA